MRNSLHVPCHTKTNTQLSITTSYHLTSLQEWQTYRRLHVYSSSTRTCGQHSQFDATHAGGLHATPTLSQNFFKSSSSMRRLISLTASSASSFLAISSSDTLATVAFFTLPNIALSSFVFQPSLTGGYANANHVINHHRMPQP